MLLGSPLGAFRTLGTSWSSNPRYRINPNFPDHELSGTREQQVEILRAAANAWATQSAADFEFVYLGTSARVGMNTSDGINNVSWVNTDGGATVAATLVDGIGNRALGLDHTPTRGATMSGTLRQLGLRARTLLRTTAAGKELRKELPQGKISGL